MHLHARGIDIIAFDPHQIAQLEQVAAPGQLYDRVAQFLDRFEIAGRFQHDLFVAGEDLPAGKDDIAGIEDGFQLSRGDAQLRQAGIVEFHEDPFLLGAVDLHLGRFFDQQQLVAAVVGHLFQVGVAVSLAGNGDEGAEDISELIIDKGPAYPRRQLPGGAVDLPA